MTTSDTDLARAMRHPIRQTRPSIDAPWRDNAWLAFWDLTADVIGVVHVSTSPNAGARHARLSIAHRGHFFEVIEPLEPGTFLGQQVKFDLDAGITLDTAEVSGTLTLDERFALADFTDGAVFASVIKDRPLHHYQQGAKVRGHLSFNGERMEIDGEGFRDRTWGYRNESATIVEYIATQCVFPKYCISAMRFRGSDGSDRAEGYRLDDTAHPLRPFTKVVRGRAGEVIELEYRPDAASPLTLAIERRLGIFPLPVSPERNDGPTLAAYEEFCTVRASDGSLGVAVVGVGSRRELC